MVMVVATVILLGISDATSPLHQERAFSMNIETPRILVNYYYDRFII